MADQLEDCGEHYYIMYNDRYVYPIRDKCYNMELAVKEVKSMVRNGCRGVRLYRVKMRRNKLSRMVYEDAPVRLVVSMKK